MYVCMYVCMYLPLRAKLCNPSLSLYVYIYIYMYTHIRLIYGYVIMYIWLYDSLRSFLRFKFVIITYIICVCFLSRIWVYTTCISIYICICCMCRHLQDHRPLFLLRFLKLVPASWHGPFHSCCHQGIRQATLASCQTDGQPSVSSSCRKFISNFSKSTSSSGRAGGQPAGRPGT